MKNRDIYLSTFSKDALQVIKQYEIGIEFNHFCISKSLDDSVICQTITEMEQIYREAGRPKALTHGPYTEVFPQAIDPMMREASRIRLDQAAEGTIRLGLSSMVVHSGYIPFVYFPSWHIEQSADFWRAFLSDKPTGFRILLENVLDEEPHSLVRIVEEVNDPRLRLCLDVGHANVASSKEYSVADWIRIQGPYLKHFHLHNNDGKADLHQPLMEGALDMEEILELIDECCSSDASLTVESYICADSIKWLKTKNRNP